MEENYQAEIEKLIEMFENHDARGIDRFLYRYQEMGYGMLAVAIYQGLKRELNKKIVER